MRGIRHVEWAFLKAVLTRYASLVSNVILASASFSF